MVTCNVVWNDVNLHFLLLDKFPMVSRTKRTRLPKKKHSYTHKYQTYCIGIGIQCQSWPPYCKKLSISSLHVLECSFHVRYKWVLANVSMTHGNIWGWGGWGDNCFVSEWIAFYGSHDYIPCIYYVRGRWWTVDSVTWHQQLEGLNW